MALVAQMRLRRGREAWARAKDGSKNKPRRVIYPVSMNQMKQTVLRAALGALAAWMVPVVASQFVADWHWGVGGFAFVYGVFFAVAMAFALITRKMGAWSYKAAVGLALVAGTVPVPRRLAPASTVAPLEEAIEPSTTIVPALTVVEPR